MGGDIFQFDAIRYQRIYFLTVSALQTLCCSAGGMRARLERIDIEFFAISLNDLPGCDILRDKYMRLHGLVTSVDVLYSCEGRISATLSRAHHTKLKSIASLIFDFYSGLLVFMCGGKVAVD